MLLHYKEIFVILFVHLYLYKNKIINNVLQMIFVLKNNIIHNIHKKDFNVLISVINH